MSMNKSAIPRTPAPLHEAECEKHASSPGQHAHCQMAMGQKPGDPPVNILIPTNIDSMSGAPTPKWDPISFDPQPKERATKLIDRDLLLDAWTENENENRFASVEAFSSGSRTCSRPMLWDDL